MGCRVGVLGYQLVVGHGKLGVALAEVASEDSMLQVAQGSCGQLRPSYMGSLCRCEVVAVLVVGPSS